MKPMYFKLYHNPENKTLTIPRAALQLSGLADAEELILHTGGGYVLAARNALSTLECLHLLQFLTSTAASLLLQLAVFQVHVCGGFCQLLLLLVQLPQGQLFVFCGGR